MIQKIFAYNIGSLISGTTQVGDIAISEADVEYSANFGGLEWWGGPDEELGYVIVYPVPAGGHPTPISGLTSYIGFLGTKNMTNPFFESTFLDLVNTKFNQNFTSGNDASIWLTTNGYWNSWVLVTPTPTPTNNETPTPTVTETSTPTPEPTTTPTNTETPTETPTNTPTPEPTTTPTNTETPTPTTTPTNTETPTPTPTNTVSGWFFYGSEGIVLGPPSSNGNTVFIISGGTSTYNPNYTGTSMTLFFNNNDNAGASYATQFQGLDTTGGTITMTQGVNVVTYSGTAAQFVYNGTYTSLEVSSLSQMIQSASTSFVSGSSINLTFNTLPSVTPTPTNTPEPTTTPTNTETPTNTPEPTTTPTNTETPTNTPTETPTPTGTPASTSTPTPTPTSGGGWFFFFADGATVTRAPNNNGETVFYDGLGNSVYNPNYTSGILRLSFNNINTAGTSYASQFSTLNNSGGTMTISQGSSTVVYSGTAADYVGTASLVRLDVSRATQMIQSAATPFVSGTSINVVVS